MEAWRFNAASNTWEDPSFGGPFKDENGWGAEKHYATIHSGDIDGDGVDELLGRAVAGMEAWRFSDTPGAWDEEQGWLGLAPDGNPALLAKWGQGWEVYARDDGQVQYTTWLSPTTFSAWQTVSGTKYVTSDPVVVSRRHGHTALFYRDSSGKVWFTEREGSASAWRATPLDLTPDISPVFTVFLPLVVKGGSGRSVAGMTTASPARSQAPAPATASPSAFSSELSAISRNENHLAVFGVDTTGQLWVKDWTTLNASDWKDTSWVKLSEGVKNEKPAVASRHSNHLAVAFRDQSGVAHLIEWKAQTGWGTPDALGVTFAGPLTLVAADSAAMSLFGPHAGGLVQTMTWTQDGGWDQPETGLMRVSPDQVMSAAVRRPGDVMLLATTGAAGLYSHFTSQGRDLPEAERELQNPQDEHYRNQVLAWVQGRVYYLAADKAAAENKWKLEAYDLDGDVAQSGVTLADHAYAVGSPVSVAAADLDFDGSDELVVATYDDPLMTLSVLDLTVIDPDTTPTLTMVTAATVTETFSVAAVVDLSVATADLDGDGRRNEVVLAATLGAGAGSDTLNAVAKLYQFVPSAPAELVAKSDGFQMIDDNSAAEYPDPFAGHWELEVAAGRFDFKYPGEQLAVAISGETPSEDRLVGFVNIYGIVTAGSFWTFNEVHHNLAAAEGDPLEFAGSSANLYRSAVATGDLDADGYHEIAVWYLNQVKTIDPNDPDGAGEPTIADKVLEPKRPANDAQYFQSPRSLAAGDIDRDGRAEVVAVAWLKDGDTGQHGLRFALLELLGDGVLDTTSYGAAQPGRQQGTGLVGDVDGDGLVSELVGCKTSEEYTVVAVVNGLPRWYEGGVPVFDSEGSYSVEQGGGSGASSGTTYNIGASLTVGFEREINIPFVGKVAEFRASVTQDFMYSAGISDERSEFTAFGSDFSFSEGLGIVVYNLVERSCYYYDVFSPDSPGDTSRAMSCKPADRDDIHTVVTTLEWWHWVDGGQDRAQSSWVDVGHRSPGGALTNELAEPGNYPPTLPVDDFLLLFTFPEQRIKPYTPGAGWYASTAHEGARTEFSQIEENTTVSVGATAGSVSVDTSATFGMGFENSNTISWSDSTMFAGGYSWGADDSHPCYDVVPYVYQATAKTLAGGTYPYWVMDYYVTELCD
jgi:hypothetical protein